MKESYVENSANYCGPESCVHVRKDVGVKKLDVFQCDRNTIMALDRAFRIPPGRLAG